MTFSVDPLFLSRLKYVHNHWMDFSEENHSPQRIDHTIVTPCLLFYLYHDVNIFYFSCTVTMRFTFVLMSEISQ